MVPIILWTITVMGAIPLPETWAQVAHHTIVFFRHIDNKAMKGGAKDSFLYFRK